MHWKSNLKTNLLPAIEMVMYTLPECSAEQQQVFLQGGQLAADAPSCRPSEPTYSLFIEQAETAVPALIDDMQDEYSFDKQLSENEQIDWIGLKQRLIELATVTQFSWVVALVMFVIAIPLAARTFSGVFHAAGWPVLLAGILTLLLSLLLIVFAQGGMVQINPMTGLVKSSPEVVARPAARFIADGLRFIARPLLMEGAALIFLGGVAIIIGIVVASRSKQKVESPGGGAIDTATGDQSTMEVSPEATPADTIQLTDEELDQPPDDEEHPSGMFG